MTTNTEERIAALEKDNAELRILLANMGHIIGNIAKTAGSRAGTEMIDIEKGSLHECFSAAYEKANPQPQSPPSR